MKRIIPIAGILSMALMTQGCGSSAPAPAVSTKQVFISFSTNATPVTLSGVDFDVYLPNNVTVPLSGANQVSVTAFSTTNAANASLSILGSYSALPTMQKVHITAIDISNPPADLRYGKFMTLTCTYATSLLASDITSLNPAGSLNFSGVYGSPQQDITTILHEPVLSISITN